MGKIFNVTEPCIPQKHYMADITECIRQIRKMIDAGAYFTINRARQYGKTTTLAALDRALEEDYLVIWLDFQSLGSASYQNEHTKKSAWTREGFLEAVRILLTETNTLFDSLIGKPADYPELEQMLKELLFFGKPITYNPTNQVIGLAVMFGFVKNADEKVIPENRILLCFIIIFFLWMK